VAGGIDALMMEVNRSRHSGHPESTAVMRWGRNDVEAYVSAEAGEFIAVQSEQADSVWEIAGAILRPSIEQIPITYYISSDTSAVSGRDRLKDVTTRLVS
jgi:hypothetical protein